MSAAILVLINAMIFRRAGLSGIRVQRSFTKKRLYAGESLEMVEVIENRRFLPVPWLRVETRMPSSFRFGRKENLDIDGLRYHRSVFFMGPWRRVTRTHQLHAMQRGYFMIRSVTVTCGDLFGLIKTSKELPMSETVTVYPPLLPREQLALPASRWQGESIVKRFIQPDPFLYSGIREYRPGDAPRDVHWRAYARTGELKIKQRDYTAASRLLILLNIAPQEKLWGAIGEDSFPLIERGIALAASLAHYALEAGLDVGFGSNADLTGFEEEPVLLLPCAGPQQRERLMEAMARLRIRRAVNFHAYLSTLPPMENTDLLLLSAYASDHITEQIARLKGRGNTVEVMPFA